MAEVLTLAEINARFADQWVLVGDPITNDHLEVQSGVVLFQSHDREQVHRKAMELRPKRFAVVFTGQIPANEAVVI